MRNITIPFVEIFQNRETTMNDSVIIYEPNPPKIKKSPVVKKVGNRSPRLQRAINKHTKSRSPLRTVYEIATKSNNPTSNEASSSKKKRKLKRARDNDSINNVQPPRKKRKSIINETIIILSDDDEPATETSDIIVVNESPGVKNVNPKTVNRIKPRRSERQAAKKGKRIKNCENVLSKNNSKADDDEELAVVWASTHSGPTEIIHDVVNSPVDNSLFFIDVEGDMTNLDRSCLLPTPQMDCNANSCQDRNRAQCSSQEINSVQKSGLPKIPKISNTEKLSKNKNEEKQPKKTVTVEGSKLREIIVDGCNVTFANSVQKSGLPKIPKISNKEKPSKNKNEVKQPEKTETVKGPKLREIIVDGCNVAFGFKQNKEFCRRGLELVVDYFQQKGHKVTIFLPQIYRNRDRRYLEEWYANGFVVFTPGRKVGGKTIVPYDDRFILEYATKCEGIVISSDQYRDLWQEKPEWRETIDKRLLAPTFVGNYVMFPEDPLGRLGPSLNDFLRF